MKEVRTTAIIPSHSCHLICLSSDLKDAYLSHLRHVVKSKYTQAGVCVNKITPGFISLFLPSDTNRLHKNLFRNFISSTSAYKMTN